MAPPPTRVETPHPRKSGGGGGEFCGVRPEKARPAHPLPNRWETPDVRAETAETAGMGHPGPKYTAQITEKKLPNTVRPPRAKPWPPGIS